MYATAADPDMEAATWIDMNLKYEHGCESSVKAPISDTFQLFSVFALCFQLFQFFGQSMELAWTIVWTKN